MSVCVQSPVKVECVVHRGRYYRLGLPSTARGNYPQVCTKEGPLPVQRICLCLCNQGDYADTVADMVDQILIFKNVYPCKVIDTSNRKGNVKITS